MLHNSPASTVDLTYVGPFLYAHAWSSVPEAFEICGAADRDVLFTTFFDPKSDSKMTEYHGSFYVFHAAHKYAVAALVTLKEVFDDIDVADGLLAYPGLPLEFIQRDEEGVACPWRVVAGGRYGHSYSQILGSKVLCCEYIRPCVCTK